MLLALLHDTIQTSTRLITAPMQASQRPFLALDLLNRSFYLDAKISFLSQLHLDNILILSNNRVASSLKMSTLRHI